MTHILLCVRQERLAALQAAGDSAEEEGDMVASAGSALARFVHLVEAKAKEAAQK